MIELSHICVNALRLQNKYHSVDFYKVIALPENPLVLNLINFEVIQIERKKPFLLLNLSQCGRSMTLPLRQDLPSSSR